MCIPEKNLAKFFHIRIIDLFSLSDLNLSTSVIGWKFSDVSSQNSYSRYW